MSNQRPPRRPTGAPGVKLLITAAALAATVGGWAVFAQNDTAAQAATQAGTTLSNAASSATTTLTSALRQVSAVAPVARTRASR